MPTSSTFDWQCSGARIERIDVKETGDTGCWLVGTGIAGDREYVYLGPHHFSLRPAPDTGPSG